MPTKKGTSPFGPAFTSAINRGTPCWTAVHNIASRCKKTPTVVFNSLCKAGLCHRQKVNGQWVYWPCHMPKKSSSKNIKFCQNNMWQWFIDWCLASGWCSPSQMHTHCNSQQAFMKWCSKFWSKQFTSSKKKSSKSGSRKTSYGTYKFPTVKSRSVSTRRYRKVA